jgi:cobalt/nickel transport system permease protein
MENKIPSYLFLTFNEQYNLSKAGKVNFSFLDRTILNSARALKSIFLQAENASKKNLIQNIHPHIKLFSLIYLVIMISVARNLNAQLLAASFIFLFYIIARLRIAHVYRKVLFLAIIFGFLIILPASLNIITPGKIILNLISFNKPYHFWIYSIPQKIGFTLEGFQVVSLFFFRVLNSISLAMLIMYTTSFPSFIKSFKILGVPDAFLMIISLAYKFIFILSRTIEETFFALKSRLLGNIRNNNIRKLVGGRTFFIFKKSMVIYENTYYAMVSRGYQGKIILHSQKQLNYKDFAVMVVIIALGIGIIII